MNCNKSLSLSEICTCGNSTKGFTQMQNLGKEFKHLFLKCLNKTDVSDLNDLLYYQMQNFETKCTALRILSSSPKRRSLCRIDLP